LELLVSRLKERRAVLQDALVDSAVTRRPPEAERRLISQPNLLTGEQDVTALRRRLSTTHRLLSELESGLAVQSLNPQNHKPCRREQQLLDLK
jgi:hypothetical protein